MCSSKGCKIGLVNDLSERFPIDISELCLRCLHVSKLLVIIQILAAFIQ